MRIRSSAPIVAPIRAGAPTGTAGVAGRDAGAGAPSSAGSSVAGCTPTRRRSRGDTSASTK